MNEVRVVTYEIEGVLNWGGVVHGSEEVMLQSENACLL